MSICSFRQRRDNLDDLAERLRKAFGRGDLAGARKLLTASRSVEATIIREALDWYDDGPEAVEQILAKATRLRRKSFEGGLLFLVTQRRADTEEPVASDLFRVGVVARIVQATRQANGTARILVGGIATHRGFSGGHGATIVAASATRWSFDHGGPSLARGPRSTSSARAPRMRMASASTRLAS